MADRIQAPPLVRKRLAKCVFEARRDRVRNPEGTFDCAGRWYPSEREDQGGDGSSVRPPSRGWPYSFNTRCRTLAHCKVLVQAALNGKDVPRDVQIVVRGGLDDSEVA